MKAENAKQIYSFESSPLFDFELETFEMEQWETRSNFIVAKRNLKLFCWQLFSKFMTVDDEVVAAFAI